MATYNPDEKLMVDSLSSAAWLEGVCKKQCIDLVSDPYKRDRILFVFDISPEEGKTLLLRFGSSQAFDFDAATKNLKGLLFKKLEELKRHR